MSETTGWPMDRRTFLGAALAVPALRVAARQGSAAQRLGASSACLAGLSLPDACRELDRLGFSTIEIIAYAGARHSVGEIPGFAYEAATEREREQVFAATRVFRHISAHLPFQDVRLFSSTAEDRRAGIVRLQHAMDGLAFLRGEMAVMHSGWPAKGVRFRDVWQPMIDTLRELGDYAARRQLKLGFETMQPDSVRDFAELVQAVDHSHVGAVIDTGHIRGATDIGLPAAQRDTDEARGRFNDVLNALVTTVGTKVLHVHVSDVSRADWTDHRAIGTGIIDFPRLFATLRRIGFRGLYVLELEEPDTVGALTRSKAYVEKLLR
jgi:sugar phosphate isomerase/epimerase